MSAEEAIRQIKKVISLYESSSKKVELIKEIIDKCADG